MPFDVVPGEALDGITANAGKQVHIGKGQRQADRERADLGAHAALLDEGRSRLSSGARQRMRP
jgi:hypothetical protein